MTTRSLTQWLAYQQQLHPQAIALGLQRVRAVAEAMALARPARQVVSVAGTNGKGSTVAFIEAMAAATGLLVELIYLALPSIEMSKLRVAERVAHGGHNIPVADIERRFPRSLRHLLNDFSHRVDSCTCFMNDGESPVLVFEQRGFERDIVHDVCYQLLLVEAKR